MQNISKAKILLSRSIYFVPSSPQLDEAGPDYSSVLPKPGLDLDKGGRLPRQFDSCKSSAVKAEGFWNVRRGVLSHVMYVVI